MEVILLEKIRHLGSLGAKVKVKPGFGRNYLVPQGKAVYATPANIAKFEVRRAELEKIASEQLQAAEARRDELLALGVITMTAKAGDEGKLFGSVGARDIAEALTKAGGLVVKGEVLLPMGAFRQIGEYEVALDLHYDVNCVIKINIIPEA